MLFKIVALAKLGSESTGWTKRCMFLLSYFGAFVCVQTKRGGQKKPFPSKYPPPFPNDIRRNRQRYRDRKRFEMSFAHRCRIRDGNMNCSL